MVCPVRVRGDMGWIACKLVVVAGLRVIWEESNRTGFCVCRLLISDG